MSYDGKEGEKKIERLRKKCGLLLCGALYKEKSKK